MSDLATTTVKTVSEPVKINKATLTQQVEDGKKKDELAKIYGLSMLQMTNVLKAAGLKIRKFHRPKFVFEEETEETACTTTDDSVSLEETKEEVAEEMPVAPPVEETAPVEEVTSNKSVWED